MRKNEVKTKLKTGDLVEVIAGKDKGKQGKIIRILRSQNRAVVEGVHLVKKNKKPSTKSPQGGIVSQEASIHLSNVMFVDPKTNRPVRASRITRENTGRTGKE